MNRKYSIVLILLATVLALGSCSKFLEEVSNDQIVPKSAQDYKEFIYGEVYYKFASSSVHSYLDIMTDDCTEHCKRSSIGTDTRNNGFGYYTWQADPELPYTGERVADEAWSTYYHHILIANITLDGLTKVADSAEAAQIKAEALMIRAYAYFMLVNLYGEPYAPTTASTAKGVPLNDLIGAEDRKFQRESVGRIYEQITDDIEAALDCFAISGGGSSTFRWNLAAAQLFASRVALFMQDWGTTISYASKVLETNPLLYNLNDKKAGADADARFLNSNNPEILFTYGSYYVTFFAESAPGAHPASDELQALYKTGDLRYGRSNGEFIRRTGSSLFGGYRYSPYKTYDPSETGVYGRAMRTAEAYLNRAEAYAHQADGKDLALADLNTIRLNRFTAEAYTALTDADITAAGDILTLVKEERRRELCFEQFRWFDLRRWDRPRIEHKFTPDRNDLTVFDTYVLQQNDAAYTLPLPLTVRELDTLDDIERPEREPESPAETTAATVE